MFRGRDVPTLACPEVKLHSDHDLTIRTYVKEPNSQFRSASNCNAFVNGKITSLFLVRKDIIAQYSRFLAQKIPVLSHIAPEAMIDIEESNVQGLEVVLHAIHDKFNDRCMDLSVDEMWKVIEANLRYLDESHFLKLKDWFASWLDGLDKSLLSKEDYLKLAVPCRRFENPLGLLKVTRYLAFNVPVKIEFIYPKLNGVGLRIEPRLEAGLNTARGSLGTILLECVESIEKTIYESKCNDVCKAMSLLAVKRGLDQCYMFPPRQQLHGKRGISVESAINRLKNFIYVPARGACETCSRDFGQKLQQMLNDPRRMFEGLCLGCVVDPTDNRKGGYGKNNKFWGDGCRKHGIQHKEPSWYFSWVASERVRDQYLDKLEGFGNGGLHPIHDPTCPEPASNGHQENDILPVGESHNTETRGTDSINAAGFNQVPTAAFAPFSGHAPHKTSSNGFEKPANEFNAPDTHAQSISDDGMDFIEEIGEDNAAQGKFAHIEHDEAMTNTSDDAVYGSSTTTVGQSTQQSILKRSRNSSDDETHQEAKRARFE